MILRKPGPEIQIIIEDIFVVMEQIEAKGCFNIFDLDLMMNIPERESKVDKSNVQSGKV